MKHEAIIKEFGFHIRRLRESRKLSQQELADLCDLSSRTILRLENNRTVPNLEVIASLSKGLEMPLKELMDFAVPKAKKK